MLGKEGLPRVPQLVQSGWQSPYMVDAEAKRKTTKELPQSHRKARSQNLEESASQSIVQLTFKINLGL